MIYSSLDRFSQTNSKRDIMTVEPHTNSIFEELKEHPLLFPISSMFALVGLLQFSGVVGSFGDRLGGLLLALFAIQSIALMYKVSKVGKELSSSVTTKLTSTINTDMKGAISDSLKAVFDEYSPSHEDANAVGLVEWPDNLSDVFSDAEKIMVVGVSASGLFQTYAKELNARTKRQDRSTRFLIVDPDSPAMPMVCQRDNTELSAAVPYQRVRSETLLTELRKLRSEADGKFCVRRSAYPIDCEYIFADYGQHKAIFLKHYTFKTELDGQLRFQIKNRQKKTFEHYHQHLKRLWNEADEDAA